MTIVDVTTITGVAIAICGSIMIPLWLQRRKQSADTSATTVVSWKGITDALQKERDELRRQLDEIEERQRQRAKSLESDWEQRMTVAKQRITDLEIEVAALRRALRNGSE